MALSTNSRHCIEKGHRDPVESPRPILISAVDETDRRKLHLTLQHDRDDEAVNGDRLDQHHAEDEVGEHRACGTRVTGDAGRGVSSGQALADATTETRQVHAVLWEQIELDLSEVVDIDTLLNLIDEAIDNEKAALDSERGLVLRLRLVGASELHERLSATRWGKVHETITDLVQEHVHDTHATDDPIVLIDKVILKTNIKLDIAKLCQDEDTVLGVIARMFDDDALSSEALAELRDVGIIVPGLDERGKEMWQDAVHGALGRIRGRTD